MKNLRKWPVCWLCFGEFGTDQTRACRDRETHTQRGDLTALVSSSQLQRMSKSRQTTKEKP